jgi:predicted transcriptional regulator
MNLSIPVSEMMTKEVVSVSPLQKLVDVKHIFEKRNFHHHIPVTEKGKLLGMISLVDYLYGIKTASLDDDDEIYHTLCVRDIMRENPITKTSSATFKQVSEELAKGEVHAILIADEGYLKGIVSTADVIRFFLTQR